MDANLVKSALTPDFHSKAAYVGRIKQTETVEIVLDDGSSVIKDVTIYISWDSMEQMLALVRDRAKL